MTNRSQAGEGVALVECINPYIKKYRIRFDVQPYVNEEGEQRGVSFYEVEVLGHKPTMQEIRQKVLDEMNRITDERILEGFVWNGMPVWLSSENQFNYKSAYDLAVMSEGKTLPVTFKFGTAYEPVYHNFQTLEDISDFYLSAIRYISDTLAEGWTVKDGIDWGIYEPYTK